MEHVLMMEPRCWRIIWRPKTWLARKVPFRLISITLFHSSSDTSTVGIFLCAPEVTIRTSTWPKASTTSSQRRCRLARFCTSEVTRSVRAPSASSSAPVESTLARSRLLAIVMAPAWTNPRAMASPIPLVPPRTTATRSFRENCSRAFMGVRLNIQRANFDTEGSVQFLTLQRDGWDEPGVLSGGEAIGLKGAGFDDLLQVIAGGPGAMDRVSRWLSGAPRGERLDPAKTRLRAPIRKPPKIICIGLNYRDHAAEARMTLPEVPTVFAKFGNTVTGHLHPIVLPRNSVKPDYEAEFAVVIGKGGRHIPEGRWREHVFGYTIVNDVSARDFQMATSQWIMGKTFDTF